MPATELTTTIRIVRWPITKAGLSLFIWLWRDINKSYGFNLYRHPITLIRVLWMSTLLLGTKVGWTND